MEKQKQMKKFNFSTSSILLIVCAIILVIIVVIMLSSNKNETETSAQQKQQKQQQVTTETPKKEESSKNSSSQPVQPETTQEVEEFVEKLDDGTKVNTSEKVKQSRKLSKFEVTDINLTTNNGISTMIATVKNTGSTKTEEKEITIQILDKDGKIITDFLGVINPIEPGGTTTLNASVTSDVSNAYDFKIIE